MSMFKKFFIAGVAALALLSQTVSAADCRDCGTVKSVHAVKIKGKASGGGAIIGGVAGGLLGNQFGHGTGRTLTTIGGAAGGAYAGNEVEKRYKSHTVWKVAVDMDHGKQRTFTYGHAPHFAVGDRVRIEKGKLIRIDRK